jgi:hypothetical protein
MTAVNFGSSRDEVHTVTNPQLAALLTDTATRHFLEPFFARNRSVKEAADEAGCAIDTMLYRVRVFLKAGLLKSVEERKRKGRTVKVYRTAFDDYFIPHQITPFATLEERLYAMAIQPMREWARSAAQRLQQRGVEGIRMYRDTTGEVWSVSAVNAEGSGDFDLTALVNSRGSLSFDISTTLYLTEQEARETQFALVQLIGELRSQRISSLNKPFKLSVFFNSDLL